MPFPQDHNVHTEKGTKRMKTIFKRYVPLLAVLVMAVMLAACSSVAGNTKDAAATAAPASASPAPVETAQAAKTVYPLTIENHTNNGKARNGRLTPRPSTRLLTR